jgi:LuxR family quorum sensing-dependent transcriptional regulator
MPHSLIRAASIADDIDHAPSFVTLNAIVRRLADEHGFAFVKVVDFEKPDPVSGGPLLTFGEWPATWLSHYHRSGYIAHDPLVKGLLSGLPSVRSETLRCSDTMAEQIAEEERSFGLEDVLAIPIRVQGRVKASVCAAGETSAIRGLSALVFGLVAPHLYRAAERLSLSLMGEAGPSLSGRELTCLRWSAAGKTSREIAVIMDISEHTANAHIRNATTKLGVATRVQAVAEALRRGLM